MPDESAEIAALKMRIEMMQLGINNLAAFCKTLHERIGKLEAAKDD